MEEANIEHGRITSEHAVTKHNFKAILLWLNYKNTYDYWREQRNKMLKSKRNSSLSTPSVNAALVCLMRDLLVACILELLYHDSPVVLYLFFLFFLDERILMLQQ